ncbi:serine/threonine-protein kinase HipA [Marinobacter sp. LV10R520-4]|uniref:type II toxin-antitoxin system HipA family toxin n=1 Tax=Marinobacter sp. LV10R520-4 TaxID=1761796 RepID=UPI000C00B42C|nr:type II toxin-antitoxin system HipA family toxin [Marinobacter sp. LV10R520-4]PFG53748.1 serine/threonine-protein kinase HipA [Marinobacter sp. LV10R520-4]
MVVRKRHRSGLDPEDTAEVMLWGKAVGALMYDRQQGVYRFGYDPDWHSHGLDIAPLTMPLNGLRSVFEFTSLNPETYKGLPGCFADTLPDDFGNAVINAWIARQGRDPKNFSAVERLLYTGTRGMGALEFLPVMFGANTGSSESLELDTLVRTAQKVLDERARAGGEIAPENNSGIGSIFQVGSSAGGARPKAVVALNKNRTDIRSGQMDAPVGYEHYLLKFDGVTEHRSGSEIFGDPMGFGLMEYTYYQMATLAGIRMEPSEILLDGPRAHFLTRRFDRKGNDKIHMQTLCAMAHADYKKPGQFSYEELFQVARRLRLSRVEALELYRRMVFNVVARNQDDHTKNFSFLMSKEGVWSLAPAYDIAYSYRPGSFWVEQHNISLNGRRSEFTQADLLAVASQIGNFPVSDALEIIRECTHAVSQWRPLASRNNVPKSLIDEIEGNLRLDL